MGYSARYHAASLAAVFLALAIGILIGSQFGGDLLTSTRKDLEKSLTRDLDSARSEIGDLNREAEWSDSFGQAVFPLLVDSRLVGRRIGLVGFGELPSGVTDAVEQAIEPTGGSLVAVGALRQPPGLSELAESLAGTRYAEIDRRPGMVGGYGHAFGRQLVTGGRILELSSDAMMSQSSGQFGRLDGLVLYRGDSPDTPEEDARLSDRLNAAVIAGASGTGVRLVGVEATAADPSGLGIFRDRNLTTVDNVDMPSGKLSLVYTLNGVVGNFGVKQEAGRLMPELLAPPPAPRLPVGGPGKRAEP